jgi:S-adenosylmethionine-dependent methyltransferase
MTLVAMKQTLVAHRDADKLVGGPWIPYALGARRRGVSEIVRRYYDEQVDAEWERLERPYRRFELVSTLRLVGEYFPKTGRVADIGGGPGRYAVELLRLGYRVTLVDLSEKVVAFAREKLEEQGVRAEEVRRSDARDLSDLATSSFDAALQLGPMYHIVSADDRKVALLELHRILKPGAPAIVGFINPWGVLRSGLTEFPNLYANYDTVKQLTDTYIQVGEQRAFTEAAFITPPRALRELRDAGFAVVARAGVEGFASGALRQVTQIAEVDPSAYETICRLVGETCELPAYRDCTEHLHVVVRCLK